MMKRTVTIAVIAAAAACGGDGGDDGDGSPCNAVTLGTAAQDLALPTGYAASSFTATSTLATCGAAGTPTFVTTDLSGDGRADIVVTRHCGDDTVGSTHWDLHRGGSTGFAAATPFALPPGYSSAAFFTPSATVTCGAAGAPTFTLFDLTGDGRLDLVITRLCGDATVGDTRWIVHAGGDDGFDATPTTWSLPTGYPIASFDLTAATVTCGPTGAPSYLVGDTDGDGHPDLVVTRKCGDNTVGDTQWIVHRGGNAGFGAAASWTLPTGYSVGAFTSAAATVTCGAAGAPSYAAVDADGDRRIDLLVTRKCGDDGVGTARWIVHPGGAIGFGVGADWTLPPGYAVPLVTLGAAATCGAAGTPTYLTFDVTGDRRLDLVVSRLCGDTTVGDTRWLVHRGSDTGFAATADGIALPAGYIAAAFTTFAGQATCGAAGTPSFIASDVDGDRRPDLLVTRKCGDATVGDTRWILHGSTCLP